MRGLRLIVCVLALCLLGPVPTGAAAPSTSRVHAGHLRTSLTEAIAGEQVVLRGDFPTRVRRPVQLQVSLDGGWATYAAARTSRRGRFTFDLPAPDVVGEFALRAVAPRVRRGDSVLPALVTDVPSVRIVPQSASYTAPAAARAGDVVTAVARLSPARPGREVVVELVDDTGATSVLTSGVEDDHGQVSFSMTVPDLPGTYLTRAVRPASDGVAAVSSPAQVTTVSDDPPAPGIVPAPGLGGAYDASRAQLGLEYAAFFATDGDADGTWTVAGPLPDGLWLDAADGPSGRVAVRGWPQAAGPTSYTLELRDGAGAVSRRTVDLDVAPWGATSPPAIDAGVLPGGVVGAAYAAALRATDGRDGRFFVRSLRLPAGLTLDPLTGALTGTPETAGDFSVEVEFCDFLGQCTAYDTVPLHVTG